MMLEVKVSFIITFPIPTSTRMKVPSEDLIRRMSEKLQFFNRQYKITFGRNLQDETIAVQFDLDVLMENANEQIQKTISAEVKSQLKTFPGGEFKPDWLTIKLAALETDSLTLTKTPWKTTYDIHNYSNHPHILVGYFELPDDISQLPKPGTKNATYDAWNNMTSLTDGSAVSDTVVITPVEQTQTTTLTSSLFQQGANFREILERYQARTENSLPAPETALRRAALKNNPDDIEALVKHGIDINAKAKSNGFTALHRACYEGRTEAAEKLIALGADKTIIDDNGNLAEDVIKERARDAILTVLNASSLNNT